MDYSSLKQDPKFIITIIVTIIFSFSGLFLAYTQYELTKLQKKKLLYYSKPNFVVSIKEDDIYKKLDIKNINDDAIDIKIEFQSFMNIKITSNGKVHIHVVSIPDKEDVSGVRITSKTIRKNDNFTLSSRFLPSISEYQKWYTDFDNFKIDGIEDLSLKLYEYKINIKIVFHDVFGTEYISYFQYTKNLKEAKVSSTNEYYWENRIKQINDFNQSKIYDSGDKTVEFETINNYSVMTKIKDISR